MIAPRVGYQAVRLKQAHSSGGAIDGNRACVHFYRVLFGACIKHAPQCSSLPLVL